MTLPALIWLAISTTLPAPAPPPWTKGLPQAEHQADGTYLPQPLDTEVLKRLLFLDRYQTLCQQAIDATAKVCDARIDSVQAESTGSTWQWPAAIGLLTGAAAGWYLGHY